MYNCNKLLNALNYVWIILQYSWIYKYEEKNTFVFEEGKDIE